MLGGAFLCYEGFEKLAHRFLHPASEDQAHHDELVKALSDPAVDVLAFEQAKIKGAVRTDFILSAEIIAITLGTVAASPFATQVAVLSGIALIMTIGVYGLVACIVKLDDAGLYLSEIEGEGGVRPLLRAFGRGILSAAPYLMKGLSVAGTAAMFLVGGGILTHGVPALHHGIEALVSAGAHARAAAGPVVSALLPLLLDALVGIAAGAVVLAGVTLLGRLRGAVQPTGG
jgi:uncharacterized protein